jgi:hypothetical protein
LYLLYLKYDILVSKVCCFQCNLYRYFWEQMLVGNAQAVVVGVVILISREGWNTGITLLTPENLFTGFTGVAALAVVLQATSGIIAAAGLATTFHHVIYILQSKHGLLDDSRYVPCN